MLREVTVRKGAGKLAQEILVGEHRLSADEPPELGEDLGPAPHELLAAALGACTTMTLRVYAERKGWPLAGVTVRLTQEKLDDARVIRRQIEIEGDLSDEQRARLADIATRCPVARTLLGSVRIEDTLAL